MAISTYTELQTAIQTWLDRTGAEITANTADFITLANARIGRDLPSHSATDTLTGSAGSRYLTLPTGFIEPIQLVLTTFGVETEITPIANGSIPLSLISATPRGWFIDFSSDALRIGLDCPCDQAHTFILRSRKKFQLNDSTPTNWLLTNHPDIYLYGSLVEVAMFTEDDAFAQKSEMRYQAALKGVKQIVGRQAAPAVLMTELASLVGPDTFNINTGA